MTRAYSSVKGMTIIRGLREHYMPGIGENNKKGREEIHTVGSPMLGRTSKMLSRDSASDASWMSMPKSSALDTKSRPPPSMKPSLVLELTSRPVNSHDFTSPPNVFHINSSESSRSPSSSCMSQGSSLVSSPVVRE